MDKIQEKSRMAYNVGFCKKRISATIGLRMTFAAT